MGEKLIERESSLTEELKSISINFMDPNQNNGEHNVYGQDYTFKF